MLTYIVSSTRLTNCYSYTLDEDDDADLGEGLEAEPAVGRSLLAVCGCGWNLRTLLTQQILFAVLCTVKVRCRYFKLNLLRSPSRALVLVQFYSKIPLIGQALRVPLPSRHGYRSPFEKWS